MKRVILLVMLLLGLSSGWQLAGLPRTRIVKLSAKLVPQRARNCCFIVLSMAASIMRQRMLMPSKTA